MVKVSMIRQRVATAAVLAGALALMTGLASAGPASAGSARQGLGHPTVSSRQSEQAAAGMSYSVVHRPGVRHQISATTYCYDGLYTRVNGYEFGIVVWWVAMETNFCYNYNIVTSHYTAMSDYVAGDWLYLSAPIQFSCFQYVAGVPCSGNQEVDYPQVINSALSIAVQIEILQQEYEDGDSYWYWKTTDE